MDNANTNPAAPTSKRIHAGCYEVSYNGTTGQVRKVQETTQSNWYWVVEDFNGDQGGNDWVPTKADAVEDFRFFVDHPEQFGR